SLRSLTRLTYVARDLLGAQPRRIPRTTRTIVTPDPRTVATARRHFAAAASDTKRHNFTFPMGLLAYSPMRNQSAPSRKRRSRMLLSGSPRKNGNHVRCNLRRSEGALVGTAWCRQSERRPVRSV